MLLLTVQFYFYFYFILFYYLFHLEFASAFNKLRTLHSTCKSQVVKAVLEMFLIRLLPLRSKVYPCNNVDELALVTYLTEKVVWNVDTVWFSIKHGIRIERHSESWIQMMMVIIGMCIWEIVMKIYTYKFKKVGEKHFWKLTRNKKTCSEATAKLKIKKLRISEK